jgi:hypothetical protein
MLDFGPKISDDDYRTRSLALLQVYDARQAAGYHREEFNLQVDNRLGTGFPGERREALYRAWSKARAPWRLLLAIPGILWGRLFGQPGPNAVANRHVHWLFSGMRREVGKVLSPEEAEAFLGT